MAQAGGMLANGRVRMAVKKGELPDLKAQEIPCVDCGARATSYDHRDYSKPLEVEPVCNKCNSKRGPALPNEMGGMVRNVTLLRPEQFDALRAFSALSGMPFGEIVRRALALYLEQNMPKGLKL
jgi:hypothetical protein